MLHLHICIHFFFNDPLFICQQTPNLTCYKMQLRLKSNVKGTSVLHVF